MPPLLDANRDRPQGHRVDELPKQMTLTINMVYPTTLPLATFPAKLLRLLPAIRPSSNTASSGAP